MKKITECKERWCCTFNDLVGVPGTEVRHTHPVKMYCKHCGTIHKYEGSLDAAGSMDYGYVPTDKKVTL